MTWTTRAVALLAGCALAACGLGAPQYPTFGQTAYRIDGTTVSPDGGAPNATTFYRDGPRMRVETTLPGRGRATIVFNDSTNAAFVLSSVAAPPVQAAVAAPPPGTTTMPPGMPPATVSAAAPSAAPAGVGVAIRVADAEAPQPLEAPWAALGAEGAQAVGACNAAGESGNRWRPRQDTAGVERSACITSDGIVLDIREGERVLFQATRLERGPQAASLFGVPPGYQVIDPQAVVDGVGETMEQLDSVTGATPPAARAPASAHPATN